MIITLINGNTSPIVSKGIQEAAEQAAFSGTEIQMVTPASGPATIEGYLDAELSAVAVCEEVARHQGSADAFIIACFSDPGLFPAREMVVQPVIGIAEAAMVTAVQLGHRFSLLSPLAHMRPILRRLAFTHGFYNRLASIQTVDMSVAQAAVSGDERMQAFLQAGRRAVEEDGAEVLILAGAVLANMEVLISKELNVPVLDPIKCAMMQAQGLAYMNLQTSKIGGFSPHRTKNCLNCPPNLEKFYL